MTLFDSRLLRKAISLPRLIDICLSRVLRQKSLAASRRRRSRAREYACSILYFHGTMVLLTRLTSGTRLMRGGTIGKMRRLGRVAVNCRLP